MRGHYQKYSISGNSRMIQRYYYVAKRLVFKWLNRRSQKVSFDWDGFNEYLKHYPLPKLKNSSNTLIVQRFTWLPSRIFLTENNSFRTVDIELFWAKFSTTRPINMTE